VGSLVCESHAWRGVRRLLRREFHGEMAYMARTSSSGCIPAVAPWARSIVSVALNYNTPSRERGVGQLRGWISRYAWVTTTMTVMQAKLDRLLAFGGRVGAEVEGRVFVDAGPVLAGKRRARGARVVREEHESPIHEDRFVLRAGDCF